MAQGQQAGGEGGNSDNPVYSIEAESPHDDGMVTFDTTRESKAHWWLVIRDATVTDGDGREVTGEDLWDRLGDEDREGEDGGSFECEYDSDGESCEDDADVVLVAEDAGFTGTLLASKNVYCQGHADELLDDDRLNWQETDEDPAGVRA